MRNQKKQLTLLVVAGDGPSLLGRDWLTHIKIDWSNLYNIQCETVDHLLEQHKVLFSEGLGTLNGYEATFQVDTTVKPKYCKARPVPYAMKVAVEAETM